MTGAEILTLIGKSLISGTFSQIAKSGVSGVGDWIAEQSAAASKSFTHADRNRLEALLSDRRSLAKAVAAQFKTVRRSGLALIGPSGVGKTSLFNYLNGKAVIQPIEHTSEREVDAARFGARFIRIADTPGAHVQMNRSAETFQYIKSSPIDVLILMVAYGYLDTVNIAGLRRPGRTVAHKSRAAYLRDSREEEVAWLDLLREGVGQPRRKIPYCMVVINKMDQWGKHHAEVVDYYRSGPIRSTIDLVVKQLCRSGVTPSFHPVACAYNSFKNQAPIGEMSAQASALSLAVLRAEIHQRLSEVQ